MFDILIFHVLVDGDVLELALCWNLDSSTTSFSFVNKVLHVHP